MADGNIEDMMKQLSRPIEELADEAGVARDDISSFIDGVVSGNRLDSVVDKTAKQVSSVTLPIQKHQSDIDIDKGYINYLIADLLSSSDPLLKQLGKLIKESGDINAKIDGCTGLQVACSLNLYYVQKFLLASADPDMPNDEGDTALHISCKLNDKEITETLLDVGADPNRRNRSGLTPLHLLEPDNIDIIRAIKESKKYRSKMQDLHNILKCNNPDISDFLSHNNDDIELPYKGRSLLHLAASRDVDIAKALIDAGAMLNKRDSEGETPLMVAIKSGSYNAIKYLINAHADVEMIDYQGNTASSLAKSKTDKVFSKLLDSRFITKDFISLIWQSGYYEFADLIEHENDIDAKDVQGYTIMHRLSLTNDMDLMKLCIKYGADIDSITNILKATPLMCAASSGNQISTLELIKAGADMRKKTVGLGKIYSFEVRKEGMTAYDMALQGGHDLIAEKLKLQEEKFRGSFLQGVMNLFKR